MTKAFSTDSEVDVAAVKDIWPQYCASLIDGDIDRWISLWSDDGIQMPPDTPAKKGKEKIREAMQPLMDLYHWDISVYPEETHVTGDWAFSRGNYTSALVPKGDGEKMEGTGKFLTIFQRHDDGCWRIARDCFNGNGPSE